MWENAKLDGHVLKREHGGPIKVLGVVLGNAPRQSQLPEKPHADDDVGPAPQKSGVTDQEFTAAYIVSETEAGRVPTALGLEKAASGKLEGRVDGNADALPSRRPSEGIRPVPAGPINRGR